MAKKNSPEAPGVSPDDEPQASKDASAELQRIAREMERVGPKPEATERERTIEIEKALESAEKLRNKILELEKGLKPGEMISALIIEGKGSDSHGKFGRVWNVNRHSLGGRNSGEPIRRASTPEDPTYNSGDHIYLSNDSDRDPYKATIHRELSFGSDPQGVIEADYRATQGSQNQKFFENASVVNQGERGDAPWLNKISTDMEAISDMAKKILDGITGVVIEREKKVK